MAENKTLEIWESLPTWAKGAIAVGGLAVIYFTARTIVKSLKGLQDRRLDNNLLRDTQSDYQSEVRKGKGQTISDSQIEAYAQKLAQAFDGCMTSEESVYSVFKGLNNKADLLALIRVYGTRKYDACNWEFDFGDSSYTLPRAIESEMDSDEIQKINQILSSKGIDYRF